MIKKLLLIFSFITLVTIAFIGITYAAQEGEKIVISEEQRSQLIKIIDILPKNFSVSDFKEKSSLSRKYAIPYLEFLDRELITKKIDSSGLRMKIN